MVPWPYLFLNTLLSGYHWVPVPDTSMLTFWGKLLFSLDASVVPTHCKVLRIRCSSLWHLAVPQPLNLEVSLCGLLWSLKLLLSLGRRDIHSTFYCKPRHMEQYEFRLLPATPMKSCIISSCPWWTEPREKYTSWLSRRHPSREYWFLFAWGIFLVPSLELRKYERKITLGSPLLFIPSLHKTALSVLCVFLATPFPGFSLFGLWQWRASVG